MKKILTTIFSALVITLWCLRCSRLIGLLSPIDWNGAEAVTDKYKKVSKSDIKENPDMPIPYAIVNDTVDHTKTIFTFFETNQEFVCISVQIEKFDEYGRIIERQIHNSEFNVLNIRDSKIIVTYDDEGKKHCTTYLYKDGKWQDINTWLNGEKTDSLQ